MVDSGVERKKGRTRWARRAVCAGLVVAGLLIPAGIIVEYFACRPMRLLRDRQFLGSASQEEIRSLCHRILMWSPDPHDPFIYLADVGDKSSVPYILWALRWMPESDSRACTWGHGLGALKMITNADAGDTRAAWVKWWSENKHKSQVEWWADGFAALGHPVSASGGAESVRALLAVLGNASWPLWEVDGNPVHERNALRLLDTYEPKQVQDQVPWAAEHGSVEQRRGLAHFALTLNRDRAEPILRSLCADTDRTVRLVANGILCRRQLDWLKDPKPFAVARHKPGEIPEDEFFAPPGQRVTSGRIAFARGMQEHPSLSKSPIKPPTGAFAAWTRNGTAWFLCNTLRKTYPERGDVDSISLEARFVSPRQERYTKHLVTTDATDIHDLTWLVDPASQTAYVSVDRFTCAVDLAAGPVIWEIGIGTGNCDDMILLGPYLIFIRDLRAVLCDAATGRMLACYEFPGTGFDSRLSLVDGQLRAMDYDDALYVIQPPSVPSPSSNRSRRGN